MVTFPAASVRWSLENGRSIGVVVALVLAILLRVSGQGDLNFLSVLAIVLPALEVAMFALVVAFYFDSEAAEQGADQSPNQSNVLAHNAEALVAWFVVVLALMWGNIVLVQLAINAYVTLGVPPVWATSL
ncbi:MAG: hypothetical protein Q7T44_07685 [Parvibaculum sp.]|nr:hypothetical protein [Parvibaculum sp.]